QQQDGEYWNITIPSLETSTTYGFRFAWVFPDDSVSEFSDVFEVTTPAAVFQEVANLQAVWVGSSLKVTFDRTSDEAKNYQIVFAPLIPLLPTVSPLRVTQAMDDSQTQQTYILTLEKNKRNFLNVFRKQFTLTVQTTYLDGTSQGVTITTPMYEDKICTNTILDSQWSVVSTLLKTQDNSYGFLVTWKDDSPKEDTYNQTRVYMSDSPTGPWTLEYTGKGPAEIGPILDFNIHYIKINHQSISGCETVDSGVKQVKAIDLINFKDYPPDEFTDVTSSWVVNANTLNDLKINFKLPTVNIGKKARIFLTASKDGVNTEEYFDKTFEAPYTAGASKSVTIFADELRGRFGSYNPTLIASYSNKKGRISSIDQYDNASAGVPFDIASRANPLSGHTPIISVTPVENGYKVTNTNTNVKINYYEVYASKNNTTFSKVYSGILPAFILDTSYQIFIQVIYINLDGYLISELY
ncbi:hypothetical protein EBU71_18745, partial [bacterium]|nr:hypothetical protein [Candidatus Elulimicrobium humile]